MKIVSIYLLLFFPLSVFSTYIIQADDTTPKAMLAKKWEPGMNVSDWLMSEKFDGVRAYWDGKGLFSRTGRIFHSPLWFTDGFPPFALDGELWIGRKRFSDTLSIVREKKPHEGWQNIRYMIFDAPETSGGFEQRMKVAQKWFKAHPSLYTIVIEQEICRNEEHLMQRLKEIESLNGEGIILRKSGSSYVNRRTNAMLKVKSFSEAEAVVVEHIPGAGRNKGRLGSILVELADGKRFAIGSGFSDYERHNPPSIGSLITFKHYGFTESGIPRFASFKGIRADY